VIIEVINPNTSLEMTRQIERCAQSAALPETQIRATCPQHGPRSIESAFDETIAGAALLDELCQDETTPADAYVIACFGDPALDAAREIATVPVIGMAEAAFHMASFIAYRFGVVTTMERTLPASRHLLKKYGYQHQCSGVRATNIPVLDLEQPDETVYSRLYQACLDAVKQDGAEAIVLGCAGMSGLFRRLSQALPVPLIDGVSAAVKLAESLYQLGLTTSKTGQYGHPLHKPFIGRYQHWNQ
jgi:allantoin racemase